METEKPKQLVRTVVFGAGTDGVRLLERGLPGEEIVGVLDNDARKHGGRIHGVPIVGPSALASLAFDRIRIASSATGAIYRQLQAMGVAGGKIAAPLLEPANRDRLASLRNRHAGQAAVVIGTGPSLRLEDLDTISRQAGLVKFAFNKTFLAYSRTPFRPDYFMVEDLLVAENNAAALNELRGHPKLYWDALVRCLEPDEDTILFGLNMREPADGVVTFSEDPLEFFWGGTVTYTAIQLAFYMGCSTVYLTGVDFTFTYPSTAPDVQVFRAAGEQNHFLSSYRQPGERWNRPRPDVARLAYEAARVRAEATGRRILNATRGGALEIFPRVSFDEVFPAS